MSPRSQLLLYVAVAAAAVGGAWVLLFARNALMPKTAVTTGPSFREISQGLDKQLEAYDRRFNELQERRTENRRARDNHTEGERKNGEPE